MKPSYPVIITDVLPDASKTSSKQEGKAEKLLHKLKGSKPETTNTKVVFMPDGDRKKWFAKDEDGKYVGSEPQKQWTEEELDERWGGNRPGPSKDPHRGAFDQLGNAGYGSY
jgi:hypothetical protein